MARRRSRVKGIVSSTEKTLAVVLGEITFRQEDGWEVAYSPDFDQLGCGTTQDAARDHLKEVIETELRGRVRLHGSPAAAAAALVQEGWKQEVLPASMPLLGVQVVV